MKKLIPFMLFFVLVNCCLAQKKEKAKLPEEQIQVNKEFDENGNLIRFDSTYVWSWSSDSANLNTFNLDAIRREMENMFGGSFQNFFSDSIFGGQSPFPGMPDFFGSPGFDSMNPFGQWFNDSALNLIPDSFSLFNLDRFREDMMKQFGGFAQPDSMPFQLKELPDMQNFDYLFGPEHYERLKKEFDQFKQQKPEK
ncbi:hypothetical protein [Gaoshiqia sp. Z1-71]|uniref:hypothetical protein n=1 Tax=Gaoshiqia hydrogeniformans TaxID=3290090 RepID=UPI003BF7F839